MKPRLTLYLTVIIGICTTAPAIGRPAPNLRDGNVRESLVATEVERLKNWEGDATEHFNASYLNTSSPINVLINLAKAGQQDGIDGINQIIPYLTNRTETKSTVIINPHKSSGERRPFLLNEYIAKIIVRAADHDFYVASGDDIVLSLSDTVKDPVIIGWLQLQIKNWCLINGNSNLERRKIADVNDWSVHNRLDAYRWLGKSKSTKGRLPLERRVDFLVDAGSLNSLTRSELAVCAEALAEIGDRQSVAAVTRACNYARDYPEYSSFSIRDLFQTYHALALLNERQAAWSELKLYSDKHLNGMETQAQREFKDQFKDSQNW